MSIALRESDRRLALVSRGVGWLWHPEPLTNFTFELWAKLLREDKARGRIRYVEGILSGGPWDRATAWGEHLVRLPQGFLDLDITRQVNTLTHEHRHCDEYPYHSTFRLSYVFNVRFRWAIECQGVVAELRCMKAQEALQKNMVTRAENFANSLAKPFPGYNCQNITNLHAETMDLLMEVIAA